MGGEGKKVWAWKVGRVVVPGPQGCTLPAWDGTVKAEMRREGGRPRRRMAWSQLLVCFDHSSSPRSLWEAGKQG